MFRLLTGLLAVAAATVALPVVALPTASAQTVTMDAAAVNDALGVGVNLGNALEGPREGVWGMIIEENFFELIAEAGFDHVRVPIKFSAYADQTAPYLIPETDSTVVNADGLWQRVDWVIQEAEAQGLYVIIDFHHYDELHDDPAGHRDRFLAIWSQIATRYADASPRVLFELLNEPTGVFSDDPAILNSLIADGVATVRATNLTRPILVGPARYNNIDALDDLVLPADPNLIVTVHFYDPFPFTHQGATWVEPNPPAPVDWDADVFAYSNGWQNWSWDTTVTLSVNSSEVSYDRQWAGLSFARPSGSFDPVSLLLDATAIGGRDLSVRCGPTDDAQAVDAGIHTIDAVANVDTIDLTTCPDTTGRITLQNASDAGDMTINSAQVCLVDGSCLPIFASGADAIQASFDTAQQWGIDQGRPIHVGEFGAYGAEGLADLDERVEWTTVVRTAIRERNMSASYWEFGAGFGVYNRGTGQWRQPLLDALIVDAPDDAPDGDVNCDGAFDLADVRAIVQHLAGSRTNSRSCPLSDGDAQLHVDMGDLNRDNTVNLLDALVAAQCVFGTLDDLCPA